MNDKLIPYDPAMFLDSEEVIAAYLTEAAAEDDPNVLLSALNDVARAKGMTEIAKKTGLGRESIYKSLAPGAQPRLDTIRRITSAFGLQIFFGAASPPEKPKRGRPPKKLTGTAALAAAPASVRKRKIKIAYTTDVAEPIKPAKAAAKRA